MSAMLAAVSPVTVGQGSSPKTFSQFPLNLSETSNTGKSHLNFFRSEFSDEIACDNCFWPDWLLVLFWCFQLRDRVREAGLSEAY